MGLYIHLVTMAEQGVKNIGNLTKIIADNRRIIESTGSKAVASYSTLGRYDLVAVPLKDFQAKVSK